jgi:hypothetical protein
MGQTINKSRPSCQEKKMGLFKAVPGVAQSPHMQL